MNHTENSMSAADEPGVVFVIFACLLLDIWLLFLGFYFSRFAGLILTRIVSRLFIPKDAYLRIVSDDGPAATCSFSISVLSGKLMFRDVLYVTKDMTFRVVDGYAIFHWWQKYIPENTEKKEGNNKNTSCRLSVSLNGFEFHVYNRSDVYNRLQDLYKKDRYGDAHNSSENLIEDQNISQIIPDRHGNYFWRDLIPAIKFDINSGKVAFGNKLVETTLCFHFESAAAIYRVTKSESSLDQFAHKVTCDCKNIRLMLAPSNGYAGDRDDPPRFMGEGFVVLQSQVCQMTYLQDEPGVVPEISSVNEHAIETDPRWNLDVTFTKSTSLSYGPWADRQRDQLQRFFFPFDYQEQLVSKALAPGQRREHSGLEIKFDFECDSTLDLLFTKDQETQAVHLCVGSGSYVQIYQPWRVNEYGYMSSVVAHLQQVEASTSLEFRQVLEAEDVKVTVNITIPRIWNQTQHWSADVTLNQATWYFIFAHKFFFQDLANDWSSKTTSELLTFIPYEWALNVTLRDFEMIWMANEYNWIDCSTIWQENTELALCGESLDLSFVLSYTSFLPEIEEIKFVIQVERLVGRLSIPESNTLRRSLLSLARNEDRKNTTGLRSSASANVDQEAHDSSDEQTPCDDENELSGGWRRHTELRNGWVDVFSTPILAVVITYIYHPILPGETFQNVQERCQSYGEQVPELPTDLQADVINLEVDANSCAFKLIGMVLKALGNIKENYFGGYQSYRDFDARSLSKLKRTMTSQDMSGDDLSIKDVDPLSLRPMEANILVNLGSIRAELTQHCSSEDMAAPLLVTDRLVFEMHKNFVETRLQLQLTPTTIFANDVIKRASSNRNLGQGYLHLSGLQLRGHAMFSAEDRPIEAETLEYAWLLELQLGTLSGKITLPQLLAVSNWAELFVFHLLDEENGMKDPSPHKICQHGVLQSKCDKRLKTMENDDSTEDITSLCQTEDDYKYKIIRVSVEEVDLSFVDASCCCNVKISPIRMASCNLHTDNTKSGVSLFINKIDVSQYVLLLAGNKIKNQVGQEEACWLEAASLHAGPIISDICLDEDTGLSPTNQKEFLQKHDKKTQRLWFLWRHSKARGKALFIQKDSGCGCIGGCNFFGQNVNGPNFFKLDYLDAGQEEKEGRLFGSPDGWQNIESDEDDNAFISSKGSPKAFQRHNSWGGRSQSARFRRISYQRSARTYRSKDDESRSHIPTYTTIPIKTKVFSGTSAWSVPDSFQKPSSSIGHERGGSIHTTSVEDSQLDRQRLPSDASSFYSCTSGLDSSLPSRPASIMSLDSFTSAVETSEHPLFELNRENVQEKFILLPSVLLSKYKSHLSQMHCEQWLQNESLTPQTTRKFSLMQNLKAVDQIPRTCPKRLEFVPRLTDHYHTLCPRNIPDPSNISMPNNDLDRRTTLNRDASISENDSDKMPGKMDSLRKRRWKVEINKGSSQSLSSKHSAAASLTPNTENLHLNRGTSIVKIEGFVNIMLSPLLLEAIHRYSKSVGEEMSSQHPCTILDKIHVKSLNVAQKKYKMDLLDLSSKKSESAQNIFISVPGVNICFLQALTRERHVSTISLTTLDSELSDTMNAYYHPNPSLSLLAVRLNKFSGQITVHSQRNASLAKYMHEKLENTGEEQVTSNQPQSPLSTTGRSDIENVGNKLAGNFNLEQVQLQFSRLSNKSDLENSHTTAIPPQCSKVDFVYSSRNITQFSKDLNVKNLKKEEIVIFVMFESGVDNISLKVGKCAKLKPPEKIKHRVLSSKKSGHNRSQSAPAQLLSKITQCDVIDAKRSPLQQTLHENYSEQVLESIVVEKQPGIPMSSLSRNKDDSASSITSSLSARSDSTGKLTDIESEGEDETDAQPLLARRSQETGRVGKVLTPSITTKEDSPKPTFVLHHESDVMANFKCIWFNCASPSSVKPVPENYHLHNNLLTTGIPAVSSWMPGAEKLREALEQLQNDHRRRLYSVTSCIMALGLPEKNKMLGTHTTVSKSSEESKYLQREYSSQLIFHLRRQLVGTRKNKVLTALSDVSSIPSTEDLGSGIMALARQWKCLLGVTDEEFRPAGLLKRPVVGRGVLTERDRAILMKTEFRKSQDEETLAAGFEALGTDGVSPGNTLYSISDRQSRKASSSVTSVSTSDSENVPLTNKTRVKRKKIHKPEVEQSLYSYFSSPVASPRSSQHDASVLERQEQTLPNVTWATPEKEEDDLFGQMVSQPTSGKQIADEKAIFKTFFLGMGFLQPSEEFSSCSDKTFSLLIKLRCVRLDISEGKLDCLRKAKVEMPQVVTSESQNNTPSFMFQNFETKVNVNSRPSVKSPRKYAEEKFYGKDKVDCTPLKPLNICHSAHIKVICHSATQSINLSLIRLLLQVADMIDILGENYDGVKAGKNSPSDVSLNTKETGVVMVTSENQKCWRIMSQVSDLYSRLPSGHNSLTREGSAQLREHKIDIENVSSQVKRRQLSRTLSSPKDIRFISSRKSRDPPQLKVVLVLTLHKVKCIATLGELCLQTDLNGINFCACHKVEKQQGTLIKRASVEACCRKIVSSSVSVHLQKARLVLSEMGHQDGTVVSCVMNTSHGMYSCSVNKREDVKKSIVISLGAIDVDIPQHPVALHCMMTRSSKTLSKQLSEIQSQRSVMRTFSSLERSSLVELAREKDEGDVGINGDIPSVEISKDDIDATDSGFPCKETQSAKDFPQMSVTAVLQGFSIGASLLPSLKVEYKIGIVSSFGKTGKENSFKLDMPQHHLSFTSKVKSLDSSIPASTSIHLPRVDISGVLDQLDASSDVTSGAGKRHLKIVADIGTLNQNLSTDLLNHLIFIQKGFMKEVNDVLQRVSGESQPVPLWRTASTDNIDTDDKDSVFLIFTFTLNLKGIKITATTPSSTAVRLETGSINLEVSNNEPVVKKETLSNVEKNDQKKAKVFVRADVDLTLSLVQFLKDQGEINDFQQLAFFNTHVGMRNCLQGRDKSEEKETLLISVVKPFVYAQPVAFDKAVLLYLNYKNAYSYWNEQRMSLNEDVQFATQAVFEKLPQPHPTAQLSGFLFLQLTVSELGICLPLHNLNQEQPLITSQGPGDINLALVLTMENMLLTCCSSASFVSKGNFTNFCLRFAEKFDVKEKDWKPHKRDGILMNSCKVPNGTYEICSRTIRQPYASDMTKAGKMVMSLMWKMCGIDVHFDTEIGKRLKALGHTLTSVTGDSDIANLESVAEDSEVVIVPDKDKDIEHHETDDECFDETDFIPRDVQNEKPQKLEKEMWKQARKVNELKRQANVDSKSLKTETEILQELESAVFNEFRRDVKRKFEKQSQRSLFSLNERRPSTARRLIKSSSSFRRKLLRQSSQDTASKDEVDFAESNEMVDLGTNEDGSRHSRFLTTVSPDTSFCSPREQLRVLPSREKLSFPVRPKYLTMTELPDQMKREQPSYQHTVSFSSQKSTVVQQDLDFDLEVTVNIESGKCVFHPNSDVKIEPTEPRTYAARLHEVLKTSVSSGHRGRSKTGIKQQDEHPDSSIILLPGVEARVHYSSVTDSSFTFTSSQTNDSLPSSKKVGKHASLYVTFLVQPLPDEMLLRPAILDFIDKALNPIVPVSSGVDEQAETKSIHSETDPAASSFISSSTSDNSSFPVDIVVVARIQPSSIRISCLPTSRVECLMKIPSLDIAYSSKPSPNKGINRSSIRDDSVSSQRSQCSESGAVRSYDSGGISFTICLSRFSLCIYHPYGKQHSVASKTSSAPEEHDNLSPRARINIAQPQPISGKKDALSLCLEYIKFNLSRRRFGDVITARKDQDKHGSQDEISVESSTLVKVSGICDFGSATFTYDMRRLQEIMDFPKCWHKRGLFSRLFLGKEGTYATKSGAAAQTGDTTDVGNKVQSTISKTPEKPHVLVPNESGHRRNMSTPLPGILPFLSSPSLLGTLPRSHSSHSKADVRLHSSSNQVFAFDETDCPPSSSSTLSTSPAAKWETVVVLAVSLSKLDVSTNMANVMGKTSWSTSDLRASGNLRLTNFGERTLRTKLSIRQSTWESRGGIAGGHVELQDISSYVNVNESLGSELEHCGNVRFRYCETRIDYMGTCILMGNMSAFRISMSDDWKTNLKKSSSSDELFKDSTCGTEHTKATVFLRGTLHWKNMGLVICRSTTGDLIKMANKITTFITEQKSSSARMLSSVNYLPPLDGDAVSSLANPLNTQTVQKNEQNKDGLKYQHWSKVLSKISGLKSDVLSSALPQKGTVVGGSLEMSCWEVSLACFHGLNFRSQTWALFSITQPSVSYSTKVASVEKSCQVQRARSIQKLSFQVGTRAPSPKTTGKQEIAHMGMICKVQRGRRNPPSMGSSVSEWLSYVSSVSNVPQATPGDISPPPQPLSPRSKSEIDSSSAFTRRRNKSVSSGYKHEHESDAIFGLPSFKVDVITDHDQPIRVYLSHGDKLIESRTFKTPSSPHIVECSLESHFYDSLYVTMDVGLIFFLHEMIQAYMKENETAQATATTPTTAFPKSTDEPDAGNTPDEDGSTTNVSQRKKIRQFRSKSWKLEPTVRFLSWAGRRMEGVNIDWVLEKLGFEHARLTIPKWVQRGAMDPMDRFLSVLLYRLLLAVQESEVKQF